MSIFSQKNPVFTNDKRPEWAYAHFWAPEIHFVNGRYLAYYSARQKSDNRLAIGVAISQNPTDPFGPYEDFGQPIIEGEPGVIDIHWFRDPVYAALWLSIHFYILRLGFMKLFFISLQI